ncbi:STY4528 family pathogenicity island replication protein [Klebsiella quasipneumoniae]|uniref:STY4528 family pathogenicity island replication protein n=1 Tax=Klebsiella quasipneumoniae subsp. quasipneumoniae TaxID=1667327 RepID=A0AAW8XRQ6_9ENTR|nr:STY4528 family pathogenicity island replication protein [Klebsiella quasipneumoniae]MBM5553044.1 helix-turn-helix domain-containing protein [Klebsiella quasipneumoniae]MBM5559098.1 helix-turn-helix domain-containing protein [Klebsiella quasipneumoniae]MCJ4451471.1 STY4528 family pathogenicity island replication protein [Klebsiella quasipneumoniae]MDV0842935.1 STY4528 family pathogenicity island replication protein [Klebsiella quasipneumoniae subsp. quasipneumoniae]MDZ0790395.1 STY4528 famil
MTLPADSLIAFTLEKMNARLAANPLRDDGRVRSGLLFTGNVHDAIPRRLLLDPRLSPLDKMGWMMIRLYAQNNEGAIFPSYDELQVQLASSGKGKASRETVSRVLLMLRITGWLSLCKRVRDDKGRVRGNIYAQHDEPLTFRDAESLDPRFLDVVADACLSKNRTVSQTARDVLDEIKIAPTMRHYHSHLSLLENRLGRPQNAGQLAARRHPSLLTPKPGSGSELSVNRTINDHYELSTETELSQDPERIIQSSESELPVKSGDCHRVRKPNHYVRSFTHSVNKKTYVDNPVVLPDALKAVVSQEDQAMLIRQLQALPEEQAQQVLFALQNLMARQRVDNPLGWMLAVMKKAREGTFRPVKQPQPVQPETQTRPCRPEQQPFSAPPRPAAASEEQVRNYVTSLREQLRHNTR